MNGFLVRWSIAVRELNTGLAAVIMGTVAYIVIRSLVPRFEAGTVSGLLEKYVGVSWPFFALVTVFLFYAIGALIVEAFALGAPRRWKGLSETLHWATEACPLVGLLTTFLSLLLALLVYGEAGPGRPETQAIFITQFAIAFGSSIAGGILALTAFTLHRIIPRDFDQVEEP